MKACGIVAEFNPLHKGHKYLIDEAMKRSKSDALVVAMSGDYVQRGEPSISDKWKRTKAALNSGADLVVEIPTLFCLGNAGQYAKAGVAVLEALGCVHELYCGSESDDINAIESLSEILGSKEIEIENHVKQSIKKGLSYPAARESAVRDILIEKSMPLSEIDKLTNIMHNSNDILALEYYMASKKTKVCTIKRKGADHDDIFMSGAEYQSAAGIRSLLKEGSEASIAKAVRALPESSEQSLDLGSLVFKNKWSEVLRYVLITSNAKDIDDCPSGGEGLGNLLKDAARSCSSIDELIACVKSKRYTYTRISRLCMQVMLGIKRSDYPFDTPEYIRILGFTEQGRELLSYIKRNELYSLPIITNINKESASLGASASKMLELDLRASDIYNLLSGRDIKEYSDRIIRPLVF